MLDQILEEKIVLWTGDTLKNEDIEDYKIHITGTTKKGEGYATDVVFVTVKGLNKSNKYAEFNIVFKISKTFIMVSDQSLIKEMYQRELYLYDKVFPVFQKFQQIKQINSIFNAIPKCYRTFTCDEKEVIVLENLEKHGYELHSRYLPMNLQHVQLILRNYAKFHAISFALRDQEKNDFDRLTFNYKSMAKNFLQTEFKETFREGAIKTRNLIEESDKGLAKKFGKIIEKGADNIMIEILDEVVEESVIIHGDCWNSNFMFKYKDDDKSYPTKVIILDWQVSSLHSPALDLSYLLYIVTSEELVPKLDELLKYYHKNFSQFLSELGSEPERLFPFSTLMKHWKKFSIYGLLFATAWLEKVMCDEDNLDSDEHLDNYEDYLKGISTITAKDPDAYNKRVTAIVRYFCDTI